MTTTALTPGTEVYNQVDQYHSHVNITHYGQLRAISAATENGSYYIGIRFETVPDLENFRRARLQLACLNNYNDIQITFKGHLHANSPVFTNVDDITSRWPTETTTATLDWVDHELPEVKAIEVPDPEDAFTAMVQEIISLPGYVDGNPITILGRCHFGTAGQARFYTGTNDLYGPRLLLTHGALVPFATEWQQLDIGDSLAAYLSHDGFEVPSLDVVFMGSTTVGKAAAGMQNTSSTNLYGGDNFRGFETPATIEAIYQEEWGDENFDVIRQEHAVAGTTLGQWYAALSQETSGFWGDITKPGTVRYKLANPIYPWQIIWISAGGNDMHSFGSQNRMINEQDPSAGDAAWQAWVDGLETQLRAVLDEIYSIADPTHTYVVLPGYPNFCVKKSNNVSPQILAASGSRLTNAQDTFRQVYCLEISIAGCQFLYDSFGYGSTGEIHPPGDLIYQSAFVRAQAAWQNSNHSEDVPEGAEYNPNGSWWSYASTQINFPALGPLSYTTWSYGGVNRWNESWRNVDDITVNERFRMLDSIYQAVSNDYERVLFLPARQSMGIDSTYSVDPMSEYAQSDPLDWVEGIHPNKDGNRKWLTQADSDGTPSVLDRMAYQIPFLQKFAKGIFFSWDGSNLEEVENAGAYNGFDPYPTYIDWVLTG